MSNLRALIVGAGNMGRAWARTLKEYPETDIAGWVDIRRDVAAEAANQFELGDIVVTDDLGKALVDARPDFVVDVSVPDAHCAVTIQSLEAGVPVIGEKPMASTMDEARRMVQASEKSGKLYMVSQSRRYDSRLAAFRSLVTDYLGDALGILNSDFYLGVHFGGFRDEMPSPLIVDMAIHTFDAARYLCGRDAVAVYCEEFNPAWSWYQGNASATAIFEMEGGLRYTYRGSWCAEGNDTSWEADWRAVGPFGTASWDGHGNPFVDIVSAGGGGMRRPSTRQEASVPGDIPGGIAGALRDFVTALSTGRTPMGECHDNIKSLAMVHAAVLSSATRRRVRVQDVLDGRAE